MAARRFEAAFDRYDAFTLIGGLGLASSLPLRSLLERTSERLSASAVEYACLAALRRDTRAPLVASTDPLPLLEFADHAEAAAFSELRLSDGAHAQIASLPRQEQEAHLWLRVWQLTSYDPGPPLMELKRLVTTFAPFRNELRAALGFDAEEGAAMAEIFAASEQLAAYGALGVTPDQPKEVVMERARRVGLPGGIRPDLGRQLEFDVEKLSYWGGARLGRNIPVVTAAAFLDRFRLDFGAELHREPARALWSLRARPLLHDGRGRYLSSSSRNLIFAVRPVCEQAIRALGGRVSVGYAKAKGAALELESLETLRDALMVDGVWRTLDYRSLAGAKVEGDGLVRLDSVLIAVECKAVEFSASAREGDARALAAKLADVIAKGTEQSARTRMAVAARTEISGVDLASRQRERIEVGEISRVLPIVVTLESLGAVSNALWRMIDLSGPSADCPWVVNIDDLRWFDQQLGMPARLLHYIVVRQRISSGGRYAAGDEGDWLWSYMSQGAAGIDASFAGAESLGFSDTFVLGPDFSRGGDLSGARTDLANEALLSSLHQTRQPGWLEVALALLDLDRDADERLARDIEAALTATVAGSARWFTVPATVRGGSRLLVGVGESGALGSEFADRFETLRRLDASRVCAVAIDCHTAQPLICRWGDAEPGPSG